MRSALLIKGSVTVSRRARRSVRRHEGHAGRRVLPDVLIGDHEGQQHVVGVENLSVAAQNGIHVFAVKGNWRLDNSIQSKIIAMAFSTAAEIERQSDQ